jgi:hypothetical protein
MTRANKKSALAHVRKICLAFPETIERLSHGAPTFFAGGKKTFVMFLDDHHGDGRLAIWCAAPPGVQATLVDEEPGRFFVPAYVGPRGWVGVRLDVDVDWDEVAGIIEDGFREVATKRLIARFDGRDTHV